MAWYTELRFTERRRRPAAVCEGEDTNHQMTNHETNPLWWDLYDRGCYLEAYAHAVEDWGPFETWGRHDDHPESLVSMGRLAGNLGGRRTGSAMHLRAGRAGVDDLETLAYYGYALSGSRGYLAAWRLFRAHRDRTGTLKERSDWCTFGAAIAAALRDFETAEELVDEAERCTPEEPWVSVERAVVAEVADRIDESVVANDRALTMQPWYRPAVQQRAHLLGMQDRNDEALEFLVEADRHIESFSVSTQIVALRRERRDFDAAREALARCRELAPCADKELRAWLIASEFDLACLAGDDAAARRLVDQVEEPQRKIIARIADGVERRRVQLPIAFVRQHRMTCAPATLSAIARYWERPAAHTEIVEKICYGGTPAPSERRWAEENDLNPREFTVTWEQTIALIDRGVPFTLTTVEPDSAHLQAVVGYDTLFRTFLIRDSNINFLLEYDADKLLEHYAVNGPRAMVLVPTEEAARLDDIDLLDAELFDLNHEIALGLIEHRRDDAGAALEKLESRAPDHRLVLTARAAVADYDDHVPRQFETAEALVERYDEDLGVHYRYLTLAATSLPRTELIKKTRSVASRPKAGATFRFLLAETLGYGADHVVESEALLRAAHRERPQDPRILQRFAMLCTRDFDHDQSWELMRLACCLEPENEATVENFFAASCAHGRTSACLDFLRDRCDRLGDKSAGPWLSLTHSLVGVGLIHEALESLENGMARRPDDATLRLQAAVTFAHHGRSDRSEELFASTAGAPPTAILRGRAMQATIAGKLREALDYWQRVLEIEPLALDAHQEVARLVAATRSEDASWDGLEEVVALHPHHRGLGGLYLRHLATAPAKRREAAVRDHLTRHDDDAWAWRELALILADTGRLDEAFEALRTARLREPNSPSALHVEGGLLLRAGRLEEARAAYFRVFDATLDKSEVLDGIILACENEERQKEALTDIGNRLSREAGSGEVIVAWSERSEGILDRAEIETVLRHVVDRDQGGHHVWIALAEHLARADRLTDAGECAMEATRRFPATGAVWSLRARMDRLAGDYDESVEALRRAMEVAPGDALAVTRLAEGLEQTGAVDDAIETLEVAVARIPTAPEPHALRAEILWRSGRREEARVGLLRVLELNPTDIDGWRGLAMWCKEMDEPERAVEELRALVARRPDETSSWFALAAGLSGFEHIDERLRAIERVLELSPRHLEAHDLRSSIYSEAGRLDEGARELSRPDLGNDRRRPRPSTAVGSGPRSSNRRGARTYGSGDFRLPPACEREPDVRLGVGDLARVSRGHGRSRRLRRGRGRMACARSHESGWARLAGSRGTDEAGLRGRRRRRRVSPAERPGRYACGSATPLLLL